MIQGALSEPEAARKKDGKVQVEDCRRSRSGSKICVLFDTGRVDGVKPTQWCFDVALQADERRQRLDYFASLEDWKLEEEKVV